MGRWSARSDAWATWEQAGAPGSARHVNNFGNTSPLLLGARTVRCHDGARACDQTPHKCPSHTRCGSMPREPMLPNCIIRLFTSQDVPTGLVLRDMRALAVLIFRCISSVFRKLPESARIGRSAEFTWPSFGMEGV
jgi:hypothetical protein